MKYMDGDLLDLAEQGHFDVIVHGCNCFCNMGAGIARTIKERYPEAFVSDLGTVKGDVLKLGTFNSVLVGEFGTFAIYNAYTQYDFWSDGPRADYEAIESAFRGIKKELDIFRDKMTSGKVLKVGIPKIGAGLAGGDWNIIERIIDSIGFDDITCVNYVPTKRA